MKSVVSIIIGKRVRKIRISQGKSMTTLANESDMEYVQLSRIELGQINTTIFQLYKISQSLGIKLEDFFNNIDDEIHQELISSSKKI